MRERKKEKERYLNVISEIDREREKERDIHRERKT